MAITITLGKKRPPPGVDLGSGWMKIVKLGVRQKRPFLERVARVPLPGADADRGEKTAARLRDLWQSLGIKENSVVSAMTGHAVIIKRVSIPAEAANGMEQFLAKEARQYIPFDLQDVYLDHYIFGPGPREGTLDMVLVASKKKEVEERLMVLTKAGLETRIMDVDAFALSNCFAFNYPELRAKPQYLLDIGAQLSVFCVVLDGQIVFQRELSLGGQQLTDRLAKVLNKSRLECEKLKINGPGDLSETGQAVLLTELEAVMTAWATEIRRLIGFYVGSLPDAAAAEHLFLAGGGSLLPGFGQRLASELRLGVQHMDSWRNLEVDAHYFDLTYLQSTAPQFAVAVGLALREAVA